jgi:hypothetical protein
VFRGNHITRGFVRRILGRDSEWKRRVIEASGLFDAGYYIERHPENVEAGFDALGHYLNQGASEMRDPSPFFRTRYYIEQNPDVANSGLDPLLHFIQQGAREGRDPSPFFDTSFYLDAYPDVKKSGQNPLTHFLLRGRREGREPVPRTGPRVHIYTTCWNEIRLLGFFFRHYDPIVQRYVIFDDGSTDGSLDLLRGHPKVELRRFYRRDADSFVVSELDLFNNCWKESRGWRQGPIADWVITCNIDEHLVHPDLGGYLTRCLDDGITLIPALGFQMFTDDFPETHEHLSDTRTSGVPDHDDCKLIVFSPTAIREINHRIGGHGADPVGHVMVPHRNELLLLNYQCLGIEYTQQRFAELRTGLGPTDRANNWGYHYSWTREDLIELWATKLKQAVNTAAILAQQDKDYQPPQWWNDFPRKDRSP